MLLEAAKYPFSKARQAGMVDAPREAFVDRFVVGAVEFVIGYLHSVQ